MTDTKQVQAKQSVDSNELLELLCRYSAAEGYESTQLYQAIITHINAWHEEQLAAVRATVEPLVDDDHFHKLLSAAVDAGHIPDHGKRARELYEELCGYVDDRALATQAVPTQAAPSEQDERAMYQAQFDGEYGSSVWHDVTEAAYHTFMPAHRRILYRAAQGASGAPTEPDEQAIKAEFGEYVKWCATNGKTPIKFSTFKNFGFTAGDVKALAAPSGASGAQGEPVECFVCNGLGYRVKHLGGQLYACGQCNGSGKMPSLAAHPAPSASAEQLMEWARNNGNLVNGKSAAPAQVAQSDEREYRTCCDHPDCPTCAGRGGFYRVAAPVAPSQTEQAADYEAKFQSETTEVVMSHIDRMNDVCEQDTADQIIASFTAQFDPILKTYFAAKFPGRAHQVSAQSEGEGK